MALFFCCGEVQAASRIERVLPAAVKPGVAFGVTNIVTASEDVLVYAVEETVPPGWSVGKISTSGFVDITHGKIKWGPFFDHERRLLTYELIAPDSATGEVTLTGTGSFNGDVVSVTGVTRLRVELAQGAGGRDEITSLLPARFIPGEILKLTNKVTLSAETLVYSVEDQVPAGWSTGVINHSGSFDSATSKVKWGPFSDRVERNLVCELKPPSGVTNTVTLSGVGWFGGKPVLITGSRQSSPLLPTVVSQMPTQFQPSEELTITLTATPVKATRVFAVEDQVPPGWSVGQISQGGVFDARVSRIKWGPFFTNGVTVLTYQITAPVRFGEAPVKFSGVASFDGVDTVITGQRQITGLASRVSRLMASEYLIGASFIVTNRVAPDRTVSVYAVEDQVPAGSGVAEISHEGSFDPETRRVKWGPFLDGQARDLNYTVTPPALAASTLTFRGTGAFNGATLRIIGQQEIRAIAVSTLNNVVRSLPSSVRATRSISVTNRVSIGTSVTVYAVEDQVPMGWIASGISHEGVFDLQSSKVKWGPFFDATSRELMFQLAAPTNAGGRVTLQGTASFNADLVATTGASNVLAIANYPPVALEDTFERLPGQPLTLTVASLVANDCDPEGDLLSVIEIAATSEGKGTVTVAQGVITYAPPSATNQLDAFSYTISDGFGGVAIGLVRVKAVPSGPSANRVRLETLPDGTIRLRFVGIPGRTYRIQATETLQSPTWTTLATRQAGVQGDFEFNDVGVLSNPTRFYRTVSP